MQFGLRFASEPPDDQKPVEHAKHAGPPVPGAQGAGKSTEQAAALVPPSTGVVLPGCWDRSGQDIGRQLAAVSPGYGSPAALAVALICGRGHGRSRSQRLPRWHSSSFTGGLVSTIKTNTFIQLRFDRYANCRKQGALPHPPAPAGQALQGGFGELELPPAEKKPCAQTAQVEFPKPAAQPIGAGLGVRSKTRPLSTEHDPHRGASCLRRGLGRNPSMMVPHVLAVARARRAARAGTLTAAGLLRGGAVAGCGGACSTRGGQGTHCFCQVKPSRNA